MIKEGWRFTLKFCKLYIKILHKKLKLFIFDFSALILFSKFVSIVMLHSTVAFRQYQIYWPFLSQSLTQKENWIKFLFSHVFTNFFMFRFYEGLERYLHFNPCRPNPGRREKTKLNCYFHTSLWCLKRFYECLKGPHKTF